VPLLRRPWYSGFGSGRLIGSAVRVVGGRVEDLEPGQDNLYPNVPTMLKHSQAARNKTLPRPARAASALAALLIFVSSDAGAATLAGWSQYGENGLVEARLATDEPVCPPLMADGQSLPMTERAAPSPAFPVRVCVAPIPAGVKQISAGGRELPVPIA
jgi:hypothetical protein